MAKTPHWALFGANERGFDPKDTRYQRKNKSKDISGCWDRLNLGYRRTRTDGNRRFSDSTVIFFPRTGYANNISHREGCEAEHGDASLVPRLRREQPHWSAWELASLSLSRIQSLFWIYFWKKTILMGKSMSMISFELQLGGLAGMPSMGVLYSVNFCFSSLIVGCWSSVDCTTLRSTCLLSVRSPSLSYVWW